MSKSSKIPEEMLDFSQIYVISAAKLAEQFKTPHKTIIKDYSKGHFLCAHFLLAHGIELYLKTLMQLVSYRPPNTHDLERLLSIVNPLIKKKCGYKRNLFTKKQEIFINYLNRNIQFRYPTNVRGTIDPTMFNEAEKWSQKKVDRFISNCFLMYERLNDWGYRITLKLKK